MVGRPSKMEAPVAVRLPSSHLLPIFGATNPPKYKMKIKFVNFKFYFHLNIFNLKSTPSLTPACSYSLARGKPKNESRMKETLGFLAAQDTHERPDLYFLSSWYLFLASGFHILPNLNIYDLYLNIYNIFYICMAQIPSDSPSDLHQHNIT